MSVSASVSAMICTPFGVANVIASASVGESVDIMRVVASAMNASVDASNCNKCGQVVKCTWLRRKKSVLTRRRVKQSTMIRPS